jgi:hypothetical protein
MQKKQRFVADQRYDLPQHESMLNFIDQEFNNYNKAFFSPENKILKGWLVENNGGLSVRISNISDSFLFNTERAGKEGINYRAAADPLLTLDLADNSTNYVEIQLSSSTCAPDTVALWDTTANAGQGEEFTQTVDTVSCESASLTSNTVTFTGDADKIPLAIVTTSGGAITGITDARSFFFNLSTDWNFGVSRTDKTIGSVKEAYDAITTSIKELKGTSDWYDVPWATLTELKEYNNMFISGGGTIGWESPTANTLSWSSAFSIEIADRPNAYTINAGSVTLTNGQAMYVVIPQTTPAATLTPVVSLLSDVPIDPKSSGWQRGIQVLFFRRGTTVYGMMDIPDLNSGETANIGIDLPLTIRTRLGITSESTYEAYTSAALSTGYIATADSYAAAISKLTERAPAIKVDHIDLTATTLPTGSSYSIDGVSVVNNDIVLFASSALNTLRKVTGVGSSLVWTAVSAFNGSSTPTTGDWVSVTDSATSYLKTSWRYRDSTIGWRPTEVHDIVYEPTGFRDRTTSQISFNNGTRTFTIQPKSPATFFDYFTQGQIYRKTTAQTVVIPDTEGIHFIYFNGATLTTTTTFSYDILKLYAFVSSIYWDATNNVAVIIGDERHGVTLDGATHRYLHSTVGTRWVSGLSAGNFTTSGLGTSNSDAQLSISNGLLFDEDLDIDIVDGTGTDPFIQELDPIANLPVLYRSGASGDWREDAATTYPVKVSGGVPTYNNPAGPWTTPTVTDNYFYAMWVFGTNDINDPVVSLMGQRQDATLSDAQANNRYDQLSFGSLPTLEMKVLYRLIFEYKSTYTNAVKSALRDVRDLRQTVDVGISAFVASDHGLLTGLNDADHPATAITTSTASFTGGLSASDTLVQTSLNTLSQYFGQLRLQRHPTDTKRIVIRGAEEILNTGVVLIQEISDLLMSFDGAQINMETGVIYKSDGVTALGINFTPATIPAGQYHWYAIHLIASSVLSDNTISVQVLVVPGSASGTSTVLASKPAFNSDSIKLGLVWVQQSGSGIAGMTSSNIRQLGTGSGSGGGGGSSIVKVDQVNSFVVGDAIYYNGSAYVKAKADAVNTSEVFGIVSKIVDADSFEYTTSGVVKTLSGLTPGASYFLSATTAGLITTTEPDTIGHISLPIGNAINATTLIVDIKRGYVVGGANVRTQVALANNASTTIQNVGTYDAGELAGWVDIAATTPKQFYIQIPFSKNGAGTDYYISPQFVGDTPPAGFAVAVSAAGAISITLPSIAGFTSGYVNFALNAPAVGTNFPLTINQSQVTTNYRLVTGATSILATDCYVSATGSTDYTLTLPLAADAAGRMFTIKSRLDATRILTISRAGSDTIDGSTSITLYRFESVQLISNGTTWEIF